MDAVEEYEELAEDVNLIFDINVIAEVVEHLPRPRVFQRMPDFYEELDETDFFMRFRMKKCVVHEVLLNIEHVLEFPSDRNHPTSPLQQLLIALRFYATGCFLIVAGDFGGVSTSTACRIVKRVSSAIANLKPQVIKFPEGAEEIEQVHRDFYEIAQFPKVIGTIDCTHVKIFSPGGDDAEIFRNRKGYFSINVQTISDARLKVRDVVARWPGSTHDTAIFHNSHRRALFEIGQYGDAFLLGDSGYPLKNYLLTPFLNPRTNGEVTFNERHVRTRSTVERQYGVLKRRFPVLAVGMRVSVDTVMAVIVACCVLHNMCVENNEELPPHEGVPAELELAIANGQVPINIHEVDNQYGNTRAFLANNYFNNL